MARGIRLRKESDGLEAGFLETETTAERIWTLPDKTGTIAIENIDSVSITEAASLTSTAFNKIHVCTGTTVDYQLDLPTAVGNAGGIVSVKGAAALTKVVTVVGVSGQTIDGEANRKISSGGLFVLMSDGANWILVNEIGSWIPYTPVWTGFSADPTLVYAGYFREGKKCQVVITINASGTSNATTMTVTLPFNALFAIVNMAIITNSGTAAVGRAHTAASSNILTFFATITAGAFTGSGNKSGNVNLTYSVA